MGLTTSFHSSDWFELCTRVLWNAYGTADTSGYCTLGEVQSDRPVTVGAARWPTRVPTFWTAVAGRCRWGPGELVIAGEGIVAGYLDDGDEARFIPDPFASGQALRTAERARWRTDGQLELAGSVPGATDP